MPKPQVIYIVRHAIAEERGPEWPDDSVRPLTSKGAARMRQAIRGLRQLDVDINVILTSPLLRAHQTSELLAEGLKSEPAIEVALALAPGGSPAAVADAASHFAKAREVALVGHEPDLGKLAAWFIGAHIAPVFKKGGVCRIDFNGGLAGGAGQLIWSATPGMLRALGK